MNAYENEYEIRNRFCPFLQKNVVIKVHYGTKKREECTELGRCAELGGCRNPYLQSAESSSHSS